MKRIDVSKLRKSLKLNQVDFAEKIGIVQSYLSEIERGVKPVTEEVYSSIIKSFGEEYVLSFEINSDNIAKDNDAPFELEKYEAEAIVIPVEAWNVIQNQSESLKKKDEQMDAILEMLRDSLKRGSKSGEEAVQTPAQSSH